MTIIDVLKKYAIRVNSYGESKRLRNMILQADPHFNFNGWHVDSHSGYYYINSDDVFRYEMSSELAHKTCIPLRDAEKMLKDAETIQLVKGIHINFDGDDTHCIVKTHTGKTLRTKAHCTKHDKQDYDQLMGAMIALLKNIPAEKQPEFLQKLMTIMEFKPEVKVAEWAWQIEKAE